MNAFDKRVEHLLIPCNLAFLVFYCIVCLYYIDQYLAEAILKKEFMLSMIVLFHSGLCLKIKSLGFQMAVALLGVLSFLYLL
jgi:hypothetical protein